MAMRGERVERRAARTLAKKRNITAEAARCKKSKNHGRRANRGDEIYYESMARFSAAASSAAAAAAAISLGFRPISQPHIASGYFTRTMPEQRHRACDTLQARRFFIMLHITIAAINFAGRHRPTPIYMSCQDDLAKFCFTLYFSQ